MDIEESWKKAVQHTEIVRSRVQPLRTFEDTELPYVCLSESLVNRGDTVVRRGKVLVTKPSLILPEHLPQLFGFDFEKHMGVSETSVLNFFLLRGIQYPSLKYSNEIYALDLEEGGLSEIKKKWREELTRREDIHTGLVSGPDDLWPFSILLLAAALMERSAGDDFRRMLERFRKKS